MKFGERISVTSPIVRRRRQHRYWMHLAEQGFSAKDAIYRLFAGDVFHDGELAILRVDVGHRELVVRFRNVHAIDVTTGAAAARGKPVRINRHDFRTTVVFRGVQRLEIRSDGRISQPTYHSSELSREGDRIALEIAFGDARIDAAGGVLMVVFATADVEDITPKIVKYLGNRRDAQRVISPIHQDPIHYARESAYEMPPSRPRP